MKPSKSGRLTAICAALMVGCLSLLSPSPAGADHRNTSAAAPATMTVPASAGTRLAAYPEQLTNVYSGRCIDVANSSHSNGAAVLQYTCHGGSNQLFRFEPVLDGTGVHYQIVAEHSGKCLQVAGSSPQQGAKVQQRTCVSSQTSQHFEVTGYGEPQFDYWYIIARHSGKCVAVAGFSKYKNALIEQQKCLPNSNQLWVMTIHT
ncbi:RICIN domain-containing protein [Acrocarpospora sp. B8E8]|uniref:RICIN domain-containing protein n=1 Tax=Acrocarpospora sp. B8E8 TaxID=3153572 RepID=UPI00325C705E